MTEQHEIRWLLNNPDFAERPASIREFVGPGYLELQDNIRPGVMEALVAVFGDVVNADSISIKRKSVFSGAIGVGKSTYASIAMCYMVHWTYCLKDPQKFFGLMPGSRIAFMLMSTSERQAKEVLFGDIKARIEHSPWFQQYCQYDRNIKNQFRFDKDLWIIPGGSEETRFEGYNVLCKDELTEIFTRDGWKRYDEISVGQEILTMNHETGLAQWQPLQRVNVFDSPGELVLMEGNEFSSLSTDDHRWATTTRLGTRRWRTTSTLNGEDNIPIAAAGAPPIGHEHSDALVEAVAWFYTEGARVGYSGGVIYQKHGTESCDRIRACLTALFGPSVDKFQNTNGATDGTPLWRENVNNSIATNGKPKGLSEFRLNRDAGAVLLEHAPDRVPSHEFLNSLTQAQLDLFIEVSLEADNRGERVFGQKRHEMAEAFAHAAILAGHGVSIKTQWQPVTRKDGSVDGYEMLLVRLLKKRSVNPVAASRQKTARLTITRVPHEGIVWCPTVENGTWLARRNGSVYFTGNCGVIDEGDSHKQTDRKDYAEEGFNTLYSRIDSRFPDMANDTHRGLLMVIGQMKSATGFMNKIFKEFADDKDGSSYRLTIWESFGWNRYTENPKDAETGRETAPRKSFVYDVQRKKVLSTSDAVELGVDFVTPESGYIEVPTTYLTAFRRNPVKALRDLAGIPPQATDPFISLTERVDMCQELWHQRYGDQSPVTDSPSNPQFQPWFKAPDQIKRVAHIDIATSGDGDAMGIAMAHIPGLVEVDGEVKPLIVFDMLMRIHAPSGSEIMLSDMRKILYRLKRDLRFDLRMVTFDGFQSTDSIQLLRKQRISTDYLSVDRSKQPYEDLREGIYEERVLFPRYLTALNEVDVDLVNIAYRELTQLTDVGLKIDHPPKKSKDVADAMAGCVSLLMQMPQWSRGAPILKTDASGEMRSTEIDSDTPGEIAAQVFKGKKGSPHAHERAVTFSEFLASRDARDPGMRPVDDKKDDLPFIGGPVSVPASPFGGIA